MIVHIPAWFLLPNREASNKKHDLRSILKIAAGANTMFVNTKVTCPSELSFLGAYMLPVNKHGFECDVSDAVQFLLNTDRLMSLNMEDRMSCVPLPDHDNAFLPQHSLLELKHAATVYNFVEFFVSLDSPLTKAVEFSAPRHSLHVTHLLRSGDPNEVQPIAFPQQVARTLWRIRVYRGGAHCLPVNVLDSDVLLNAEGEVWSLADSVFSELYQRSRRDGN